MIHILQSVSNMDRGGIETVLMNVYRHLDRSCFQFDFLVNKPKPGFYDDEIRALGGRVWVSPGLSPSKYPAYMRFMAQLLKDQPQIQALHAHNEAMAYYALQGAQKANLPMRIAHAHNTRLPRDYKLPLKLACKALIPSAATDYWACGRDAGLYYFGQKRWEREGVIMHNAVDLRRCGFQADKRAALRAQYGLQDRLVIGSVARFMPQKNHRRMLQIFARLQAIQPQSSLALIGEGPLMESCRQEPCKRLFPQFATHFFVTRQLYRRSLIEKNHCRFTRHQIGEDALFLVDFYRRSPECLLGVDKPYYHYRCNLSDSASHIFQAERLEDNFYLSDAIAETVREWGLQDSPSHRGAVENRRVLDLQLGIKNVCMSPLAFRQRVAWLRKALKHAGVKQAVGRQPLARVCSRNDRIKLALLKLRCNRAVILLSSLNNRC